MKSLLLACIVIAVTDATRQYVHLTEEQKAITKQHSSECIKETGISPDVLAEAKKGNFVEDEGLKKYTLCFYQKAGVVDEDGHVNLETALEKLPPGVDKVEARELLVKCQSTESGKNKAETVYKIFVCYHKTISTPVYLDV